MDTGASRCVGGAEQVQRLADFMSEEVGKDSVLISDTPTFTFGNGERQQALSTVLVPCHVAEENRAFPISVLDADVPILIGMEVMELSLRALIDCGHGRICFPGCRAGTGGLRLWQCEKLPGRHLAINLSNPDWWIPSPFGMPMSSPGDFVEGELEEE